MKKILTFPNLIAAILLLLSVAETVLMILFKPLPYWAIGLVFFCALLGIAMIRFARPLAYVSNWWHSLWHRKNVREGDDEPSDLAIGLVKIAGYVVLIIMQVVVFL